MYVCCDSGVSWNQHCDDQHWFVAVGLLQLRRGALQVLILDKLTCIWHFIFPARIPLQFRVFCAGKTRTIPTFRSVGTSTQVCAAQWVLATLQRSRVRPGEELPYPPAPPPSQTYTSVGLVLLSLRSKSLCLVSGSVWSSYRKSCVNMVMKWLVPESSSRYINRMTNEALHKGDLCTHCIHLPTGILSQNVPQMFVSFIQDKARAKYNWISHSSVLEQLGSVLYTWEFNVSQRELNIFVDITAHLLSVTKTFCFVSQAAQSFVFVAKNALKLLQVEYNHMLLTNVFNSFDQAF